MIKKIYTLPLVLLSSIILASCSDSDEQETSALEEQQHQMVEEMVENINEPLDKANLANEISEDHNRRLEEALQEQ
jgi:hypothetical protein